jgi:hypothetical protein
MANINATQLIPIDVTPGATAVNYTPTTSTICPILSMTCIGSSGSGNVKLTPYSSAVVDLGASGSGGRLRIATNGAGTITTVEIATGGTGYTTGPVPATINDVYGTGAVIACTASGGAISAVSVVSGGINYSGYVTFDVSDFIEGVTYEIIPRYIEQVSGSGVLKIIGNRLAFRPFQVF